MLYFIAGTTCATVLTQAILTEGCKSVAAGTNVMDLRSGIKMAVDAVITDLKSRALMISTPEEITQVMELLGEMLDVYLLSLSFGEIKYFLVLKRSDKIIGTNIYLG